MSDILISKVKLEEGFELSKNHIKSLLKSSNLLYAKKKYAVALPLVILAYEEITKLTVLIKHIKKNSEGITRKEWNDLIKGSKGKNVHRKKLVKLYEDARKELKESGMDSFYVSSKFLANAGALPPRILYSEAIEKNEDLNEIMEKFDSIKQDCFYLNWKNNNWFLFNQLKKDEQQTVCYIMTSIDRIMFNSILTGLKFPSVPLDKKNPIYQEYMNDPLVKEMNSLEHNIRTPEFQRRRMVFRYVMDEIYKENNSSLDT